VTDFFWCAPEFVASRGADDADVTSHFVVQLSEHPPVLNDMFVHFERDGTNAGALPGSEMFAIGRESRRQAHLGRKARDEGRAAFERSDVVHRDTDGFIGEVTLFGRYFLRFDANFFESADCDECFLRAFFHASDKRGHSNETRDPKNDPEHRQQGAEFVSPDFAQAV